MFIDVCFVWLELLSRLLLCFHDHICECVLFALHTTVYLLNTFCSLSCCLVICKIQNIDRCHPQSKWAECPNCRVQSSVMPIILVVLSVSDYFSKRYIIIHLSHKCSYHRNQHCTNILMRQWPHFPTSKPQGMLSLLIAASLSLFAFTPRWCHQ